MKHLYSLLLILSFTAHAQVLAPFSSDGCSLFPDGTFNDHNLWLACCTAHDLAYWKGGTQLQRIDADDALKVCVENFGESSIAILMLVGVRVGGLPIFPTPFRWGYGWSYQRMYGPLTLDEQKQVESLQPVWAEKSPHSIVAPYKVE